MKTTVHEQDQEDHEESHQDQQTGVSVEGDSQAKALRLRMYVLCSECARLIDLVEGNRQQRDFEGTDFIRHATEEHATWLEVLGIDEK